MTKLCKPRGCTCVSVLPLCADRVRVCVNPFSTHAPLQARFVGYKGGAWGPIKSLVAPEDEGKPAARHPKTISPLSPHAAAQRTLSFTGAAEYQLSPERDRERERDSPASKKTGPYCLATLELLADMCLGRCVCVVCLWTGSVLGVHAQSLRVCCFASLVRAQELQGDQRGGDAVPLRRGVSGSGVPHAASEAQKGLLQAHARGARGQGAPGARAVCVCVRSVCMCVCVCV